MTECVVIRTTVESEQDAERLANAVVEASLAACVQVMPIRSTYRWQGKIENSAELLLLMKTRRALATELMAFVKERHPYEVPELVVTAIEDGSEDYLDWIKDETRG